MPTYTQAHRSVRIETPFAENVLLLKSLRGSEGLGRPFQFEIKLASETSDLDYEKIIGQKVSISLETGAHNPDGSPIVRYFNGYVSRFSQTTYEGSLVEYQATVVPWLWFLTRSSNCRIFQGLTIPEILKQVFHDSGYSDIIDNLHGTYRKRNYCVQYRETAFQFVSRLMEDEGIYYYFQHEQAKHSLVLCDSPASHAEYPGYGSLKYSPNSSDVEETLTSWVVQHEVQSDAYTTNNFNFTSPKAVSSRTAYQQSRYGQTQLEQFEYLGEQSPYDQYTTDAPNENDRYSQARLEELQARFETYSSGGNARGICVGAWFKLTDHPRLAFNTPPYLTTSADYQIASAPFTTVSEYLTADSTFSASLIAMPKSVQFRSPRATPKPIVYGPQTATVVGPDGEKISTDKYGQVQVRFHWDHRTDATSCSCWMRVSQGWAGKKWGDMAIPHVGDEVIVECLEGDPDRPLVTGRVFNDDNMPPLVLPDNKHKRVLQDDFGNHLTLDATPGDEGVTLQSPRDKWEVTIGNTHEFSLGTSLGAAMGAGLDATLGLKGEVNVGLSYAANLAATHEIGFGSQWSYFRGGKKEICEDDVNSIAEENNIVSAGQTLCLVGGTAVATSALGGPPPADKNSIVNLGEEFITLSVGQKQSLTESPISRQTKVLIGATLLTAIGAGVATGFAAAEAQKVEDGQDGKPWVPGGIAIGLAALSTATALYFSYQLAHQEDVKVVKHDDPLAWIDLDSKEGDINVISKSNITIESEKKLSIGSKNDDVVISQGETTITLAKNGDVTINSRGKINLVSKADLKLEAGGKIQIAASNIATDGPMKLSGGALEIMAPPAPPPAPAATQPPKKTWAQVQTPRTYRSTG